ncbi:MAG: branched-chain amino acid ABC transporter substrate-binding protein [Anaerolineaceae bacterium]|jgi:branched-chain amino acid transport system substrate-binding protein|nr:MAG: branched-chain amino acid ABC transporter substrate-binding protein [Anaerolineaceae bacterium]
MNKRLLALLSLLVLASMILAACGTPAATEEAPAPEEPVATEAPAEEEPAMFECTDALGCVEIAPDEPVHIAYWGVLSGADSSLGEDSKRGVEIAIDDMGGQFQGHDILLTTEDGLCTPEGGATAAQKLATDTSLVGLIGSACSDETVGGIAAITNAGLTTISPANTRPLLTDPNRGPDYAGYLRTAHSDAFQGKAVAEFAYNVLGVRKAATIHDGSAYAEALQQVFADEFTALGGEVVAQEAVAKDATDMRPVLTTVAAAEPEFVYFPVFVAAGGYIVNQIRDVAGLEDVKIAGSDGIFTADFLEAGGANTEGMYLSSPDFGAFPGGYPEFIEKHNAKYGGAPLSVFHAHAYDAANILFTALEEVAVVEADGTIYVPRQALRDAIYATQNFQGVTGSLSCSPSGDCGAPVIAIYEIMNSDPASWDPQNADNPNPKKIYP